MPDFPSNTATFNEGSFNVTLKAADGRKARTGVSGYDAAVVTGVQLGTLRQAIGDMSNAAVINTTTAENAGVNEATVEVFDEAFASAATKAVFIYQNAQRDIRRIEVPAPDASIFESDGVTVNPTSARAIALNTAALAVLNAGTPAGTYAFTRGFLSGRTRRAPRSQFRPTIAEPEVGDAPPDSPGV